jgi:hypothetical protein
VQEAVIPSSALGVSGAVGEKSRGPNRVLNEITTPAIATMKNNVKPNTVMIDFISTPNSCRFMNGTLPIGF